MPSSKDRLPSAVSLVQHVRASDGWYVRLCSIDVDRGSGERVQQRVLSGHQVQAHIQTVLPHPRLGLLATLDRAGELLIWDCSFQAQQLTRTTPQPASHGAIPELSPHGAESGAVQKLVRLPGSFQAAAWLELAAPAAVVAQPSGLRVFHRIASESCWQQGLQLVAPDAQGKPGAWRSLHAFAGPALEAELPHAQPSECSGFALRADGWLGVWRVSSPAGASQPKAFEWLGNAELGDSTCVATPLVRASLGGALGALVSCSRDGVICVWEATYSGHGGFALVAQRSISLGCSEALSEAAPPLTPTAVHATGGSMPRLAVILQQAVERQQLVVLELESRSPHPSVEAEVELGAATAPPPSAASVAACCAWLDLGCSLYLLAVGLSEQIHIYLQRPTHGFLPQRAPWCLARAIPMPAGAVCSALTWVGGSLLLAAGSHLLVWPSIAHELVRVGESAMLKVPHLGPLGMWHPAQLTQELVAETPDRSEVVLRHLLQHLKQEPLPRTVAWLPFEQLVGGQTGGSEARAADSTAPEAAAGKPQLDNDLDFFAPTETASAMADLFAPSPIAQPNFLDLTPTEAEPAATEAVGTTGLQAVVVEVARLLEAKQGQAGTGLSQEEDSWLLSLLHAQQTVGAAASGLDPCGARFLLRALTARHLSCKGDAAAPATPVTSADVAWAIQSQCHSTILDTFLASAGVRKDWKALRAMGVGFWLPQVRVDRTDSPARPCVFHCSRVRLVWQGDALRAALDTAAKVQFAERKDPQDCALLFVALGKKGQLQGLYKAVRNEKLFTFLANDFSEPRWKSAALKNAFALLSKQQHELAAAFFLLGADLPSAVRVCARQLADLQLALVLCRLHTADAPDLLAAILREEVLPYAKQRQDSWLCCVAHLQLDEPQLALEALACRQAQAEAPDEASERSSRCGLQLPSQLDPSVVAFFQQIQAHPRHRPRLSSGLIPGSVVNDCAYAYTHRRCHTLAMEVLCLPSAGGDAGVDPAAATQWRLVLAIRHVLAFAEHLMSESAMEEPPPSFLVPGAAQLQRAAEVQQALRGELRALGRRLQLPDAELREQATRSCINLGHAMSVLPRLLLLSALELWPACQTLLADVSHGLTSADMWSRLPWQLEEPQCRWLLHVSASLLLGLQLLPVAPPTPLRLQWTAAAQLACLSAACSLRGPKACEALLLLAKWSPDEPSEGLPVLQKLENGSTPDPTWPDGPASEYAWARLVLLLLQHIWQQQQQRRQKPGGDDDQSRDRRTRDAAAQQMRVLSRWLAHVRLESRRLAGKLSPQVFPLFATTVLPGPLAAVWASLSSPAESFDAPARQAVPASAPPDAPPVLWPRDDEACGEEEVAPLTRGEVSLQLSSASQLLHRRGDFVRSVCVNALNPRQLAVSLGKGVQQLELAAVSRDASQPDPESKLGSRTANQWASWGAGLNNAAKLHNPLLAASGPSAEAQLSVQQSSGSDLSARCLCSHPKVIILALEPASHLPACRPLTPRAWCRRRSSCRCTSPGATRSCSAGSLDIRSKGAACKTTCAHSIACRPAGAPPTSGSARAASSLVASRSAARCASGASRAGPTCRFLSAGCSATAGAGPTCALSATRWWSRASGCRRGRPHLACASGTCCSRRRRRWSPRAPRTARAGAACCTRPRTRA